MKAQIICKAPGCGKPAKYAGRCVTHHSRWYKTGRYDLRPRLKICPIAGCGKPSKFHVRGFSGLCATHYNRASGRRHAQRNHDVFLRKTHGITREMYSLISSQQNDVCAICKKRNVFMTGVKAENEFVNLVVDHDHETHQIRGLLCHRCNRALGLLHDDPEVLLSAARYLDKASLLAGHQRGE